MRKLYKNFLVFSFVASLVGAIGASEARRDPQKTHLISSRAMIQDDFSGLEAKPIAKAFFAWMEETEGDITIEPPKEIDSAFYDAVVKGEGSDLHVFELDLRADASNPDPWQEGCRQAFYVVRVTSANSMVKMLDEAGEAKREVMAFTFTGCNFKFIAVVADRMQDEEMMYTTMLHELGHMWGLKDNKAGADSVMNGTWPSAPCITRKDIQDVYEQNGKAGMAPRTGCYRKKD